MMQIFKTVLSMSLSGAILILIMLLVARLLKGRLGRQWQYYIWLVAVLRLLLPFGPETNLMGKVYQTADRMMAQAIQGTQETWLSGKDSVKDTVQGAGQNAGTGTERSTGPYAQQSSGQSIAQEGMDAALEKAGEPATENETVMADGLQRASSEADNGEMQFFSVGVMRMDADNPLVQSFAERFYEEGDIAFLSVLMNLMDTETLEEWLDRALADQKWNFQSMLYDKLDRAFYTLDMNPAGTDTADAEFPRKMTVIMPVCRIRAGAGEAFQVVGMVGEGERVTVLGKKQGSDGRMWYLLDKESLPEPTDPVVGACYIRADLLEEE